MTYAQLEVQGDIRRGGRALIECSPTDEDHARNKLQSLGRSRGLIVSTRKVAPGMIAGENMRPFPGDGSWREVEYTDTKAVVTFTPGDRRAHHRAVSSLRTRFARKHGENTCVTSRLVAPGRVEVYSQIIP